MTAAGLRRDETYDHQKAQQALSQAMGSRIALHCEHGLASELWLCLRHDLSLFDCPRNVERACGRVRFPSAAAGSDRGSGVVWQLQIQQVLAGHHATSDGVRSVAMTDTD